MKNFLALILVLLVGCGVTEKGKLEIRVQLDTPAPYVIYDTDIGVDVDDAGALAILHKQQNARRIQIIGTISTSNDPYSAAALDAINTYYKRPNIPVARNGGHEYPKSVPNWKQNPPHVNRLVAERFAQNTYKPSAGISRPPQTAVSLYRKLLASKPDKSVTIASVGFMYNLSDLLNSPPDSISPLTGRQLIIKKVKLLNIMMSTYPNGGDHELYVGGPYGTSAANNVFKNWPTKIYIFPGSVCGVFQNGYSLTKKTPKTNPVRAEYELYNGRLNQGRPSWDLCNAMHAGIGTNDLTGTVFRYYTDKHLTIPAGTSNTRWVAGNNGRHVRVERVQNAYKLQTRMEGFITEVP